MGFFRGFVAGVSRGCLILVSRFVGVPRAVWVMFVSFARVVAWDVPWLGGVAFGVRCLFVRCVWSVRVLPSGLAAGGWGIGGGRVLAALVLYLALFKRVRGVRGEVLFAAQFVWTVTRQLLFLIKSYSGGIPRTLGFWFLRCCLNRSGGCGRHCDVGLRLDGLCWASVGWWFGR